MSVMLSVLGLISCLNLQFICIYAVLLSLCQYSPESFCIYVSS